MRILIVKLSSMGDIIHTLPALSDAHQIIENLEVEWLTEKPFAEIPAWHKTKPKIISISIRALKKNPQQFSHWRQLAQDYRHLKNQEYDTIIDAQGLVKSAMLSSVPKRGIRCGLSSIALKEPSASLFYHRKFAISKKAHAITRVRQLLAKALAYEVPDTAIDYGINNLDLRHSHNTGPIALIAGGTRKEKIWALENWRHLAKKIMADGHQILIPWGNDIERKRAHYIADAHPNAIVSPPYNCLALAQSLNQCRAAIGGDTGPSHLAAAIGLPVVALYGPTNPALSGTLGAAPQKHLHNKTLQHIAVPEVYRAIQQLLEHQSQ